MIIIFLLTGCTTAPREPVELGGGYIVPKSCGDRWACECEPDYEFLCDRWEK